MSVKLEPLEQNGVDTKASFSMSVTSPLGSDMPETPASLASDAFSDSDLMPMSPNDAPSQPASRVKSRLKTASGKDEKLCGVCGDKALGCNFDAISCESCKAFFRRNALKTKVTKCLFEGNCKIDVNTRRFCPHCRLQKCLSVGMKKELILGDSEKKKRMEKVIKNREKRVPNSTNSETSTASSSLVDAVVETEAQVLVLTEAPVSVSVPSVSPTTSSVQAAASTAQTVHLTASPPTTTVTQPVATVVLNQTLPETETVDSNNLLNGISGENKIPVQLLPCHTQMDAFLIRKLTGEEGRLLNELMQVYDLSFTVDLEPLIHIKHLDPSLNQLVNQSSITVLRLIKFAKRLDDFASLPQECQIGILKGCWIHILLLRSVSVYDCMRDVWVTPRGDIPTEILKNATGFVKLHDDHVNYCSSLKGMIGDDLKIVVVLLAIVIFSPDGPHVIARQLVSNIQDKYLVLLKHYLESKYTYMQASEMYPQLMAKMKELRELADVHGKHLLDVNPREIEPIMLEILDLK